MGNAFHKLAAFRKYELKSMFFLVKGICTFELFRSMYGDKSLYIFEMRGCRLVTPYQTLSYSSKVEFASRF